MKDNHSISFIVESIKTSADLKAAEILKNGYAESGCNGPYKDNDTAVRNSAHWCVTYAFLYRQYKEGKYLEILKVLADYLLKRDHYGKSGAALCRNGHFNDDTNGVIGQAWLIEGLVSLYEILNEEEILNTAISIWKTQVYNPIDNCFGIICTDGLHPCDDITFNHNLWFAVSGLMILQYRKDTEIQDIEERFIRRIKAVLGIQPSGKLYHRGRVSNSLKGRIRFFLEVLLTDYNIGTRSSLNHLEDGYQLFDLFGFALLKEYMPNGIDFDWNYIKKAVKLGTDRSFIDSLMKKEPAINKYAFPYNSPAFEYPYVSEVLGNGCDLEYERKLLDFHKKIIENKGDGIVDYVTLDARVYELTRYCKLKLGSNK